MSEGGKRGERRESKSVAATSFFLRLARSKRGAIEAALLAFPPLSLLSRSSSLLQFKMEYAAYERKVNAIYDMVSEGKYKVRLF